MIIKVKWDVSVFSGSADFELSELNCSSEEEWNALSEDEQEERIQEALDNLPDQPYMILEKFETI